MTYPKAIVIAATLLSAAIVWASQPAQTATSGTFQIVRAGIPNGVWRINTTNGSILFCSVVPSKNSIVCIRA